jgi:predicted nuclease with TOPRIM domain
MIKMNEEEIIIYLTNQNKKLKEEMCSLKNKIKEIDNTRAYWHIKNDDKKDKIKQLQNNWNELKKWLIQLQKFKGINQQGFSWGVAQEVLDKMQELEQGKDEKI